MLISGLKLSDMYGGVLYLFFNFHYIITLLLFVMFVVCCKPVQYVDLLLYIYEGSLVVTAVWRQITLVFSIFSMSNFAATLPSSLSHTHTPPLN